MALRLRQKKHLKRLMLAASVSLCAAFSVVQANGDAKTGDASSPGFVSIDFCADQFLLALADKSDIQAVSFEGPLPRSFYADRAQGLATVRGVMEEILLMRPRLVLRTWRGGPRATEIMDSASIASFQPPFAYSIESNLDAFLVVGEKLGQTARAEKYVAAQKQRIAALRVLPKSAAKAVYMTPSGFTAGTGTFVDNIIKLAGFGSVAAEAGIISWAPLPLEKIVLSPPDFVIAAFFGDDDVLVSHWSSGRHGVYKRLMGDLPVINIPSSYLSCSGAFAADAAEFIRAEADKLGLLKGLAE